LVLAVVSTIERQGHCHEAGFRSTFEIPAIFRFVELIWTWSVDQVSKLLAVP
jgi:hypothetical protein